MGETRCECKIFAWKPNKKEPLGRPRSKWDYNIKLYLKYGVKM
jgi:hypothetical protein